MGSCLCGAEPSNMEGDPDPMDVDQFEIEPQVNDSDDDWLEAIDDEDSLPFSADPSFAGASLVVLLWIQDNRLSSITLMRSLTNHMPADCPRWASVGFDPDRLKSDLEMIRVVNRTDSSGFFWQYLVHLQSGREAKVDTETIISTFAPRRVADLTKKGTSSLGTPIPTTSATLANMRPVLRVWTARLMQRPENVQMFVV